MNEPCPFCAHEEIVIRGDGTVICGYCEACGPRALVGVAIDNWNLRTTPKQKELKMPPMSEELKAVAQENATNPEIGYQKFIEAPLHKVMLDQIMAGMTEDKKTCLLVLLKTCFEQAHSLGEVKALLFVLQKSGALK